MGKVETECYLGTKGTTGSQRKTFCWSQRGDKENAHSAEVIFVNLRAQNSKRAQTHNTLQSDLVLLNFLRHTEKMKVKEEGDRPNSGDILKNIQQLQIKLN